MQEEKEVRPKEILVIRLSALGDVVRTLPAVLSIRQAFPECRITWVTETLGASFIEGHPAISRVLVAPTRVWRKILRRPWGIVEVIRQFRSFKRALRSVDYDMVVDFHGVLKSACVCRLSRCKRKIGYDSTGAKELSYLIYNEKVTLPEGKLSRYTRNMTLAEHIGGKEPQGDILHIPPHIEKELSHFLGELPGDGPIFVIHPGTSARAPYKRWLPERYAKLADRIVENHNARVVVTYAPDELDTALRIDQEAEKKIHLAPRTETPIHLAYIISRSDIFIGSDSAAMHIATLAGIPVVAVWGPTDPIENEPGPYSPHEMVRKEVNCSPCRKMGCLENKCMDAVEVEDVLDAVERLLSQKRG